MSAPSLADVTGSAATLAELFELRRDSKVDPIRFVNDVREGFWQRSDASELVPRSELHHQAARAASLLARSGVKPGDRVILLLPKSLDFIRYFFACQLLGAVAVPLVPPWSLSRIRTHVERITHVARVCRARVSVVSDEALVALEAFLQDPNAKAALGTVVSPQKDGFLDAWPSVYVAKPEAPAMIQFTSGSTKNPCGVILSHRSLLANCYAIGAALGFERPGHVGCSWLPLFHDMGLIGHVLVPLVWSIPTVLLPPESFALRPQSWLKAISEFQATISTAPNFAYQLAATRLGDDALEGLDLSSWEIAMCGGEPILSRTLHTFASRFQAYGFRRAALCPVYGLAEATLAVSLSRAEEEPRVESVDRGSFSEDGVAVPRTDHDAMLVVGCGKAPADHEVCIRAPDGTVCPDGTEGAIWARGPSLMSGYLDDPEATAAALVDGWLDTGDRGYLRSGELFVTGRDKELIVKGGRNIYPQEVEAAAASVQGVRPGRVAAFGIPDEGEGTDLLVVLCELRPKTPRDLLFERKIIDAVTSQVGVRPDEIVLLSPGTLSKTSSGKMQRLLAQKRYLEDSLRESPARAWDSARLLLARTKLRLLGRA